MKGGSCAAILALASMGVVHASESDGGLETITVVAAGISKMIAPSAGDLIEGQMASRPLLRPAAVLENVPGLIVTQHSGEGKANQYADQYVAADTRDAPISRVFPTPVASAKQSEGKWRSKSMTCRSTCRLTRTVKAIRTSTS